MALELVKGKSAAEIRLDGRLAIRGRAASFIVCH